MLPKGTVEILTKLEEGSKRFNQLARIKVGSKRINRGTLSSRLQTLERRRLVVRTIVKGRPPYVLYRLTNRGREILPALRKL